jgi:hypothetical protein
LEKEIARWDLKLTKKKSERKKKKERKKRKKREGREN